MSEEKLSQASKPVSMLVLASLLFTEDMTTILSPCRNRTWDRESSSLSCLLSRYFITATEVELDQLLQSSQGTPSASSNGRSPP